MYEAGSDGVVWWEDYAGRSPAPSHGRIARPLPGYRNLSEDRGDVRLVGVFQSARLSRTWSARAPIAIFRSRRMCGAITFRA